MTNQEGKHAAYRVIAETTEVYNGDAIAAMETEGFTSGAFNERQILWLQSRTNSTSTNIDDLRATLAIQMNFTRWNDINSVSIPTAFFGNQLWLDADDLSTITKDGSEKVSQWDDKSGISRHATQGTGTAQPTYTLSAIDSKPALDFDGTADFMTLASQPITGTSARTTFIVARADDGDNDNGLVSLTDVESPGRRYDITGEIGLRINSGNIFYLNDDIVDATNASIVTITNEASSNVIDTLAYKNGALLTETASQTEPIDTNSGAATIGRDSLGIQELDGVIGEVIIYDKVLSAVERNSIHNYLSNKWGITLS